MSFICHIHNYTEYNEEWNVFSPLMSPLSLIVSLAVSSGSGEKYAQIKHSLQAKTFMESYFGQMVYVKMALW